MIGRWGRTDPIWPLTVLFLGLPLWWLLGIMQLMHFAMAVPMAVYLFRQRRILIPRGFGIWLLFVAWLLAGLLVLQVDAPGAEPGGSGTRYLTFGYRYAWYLAMTITCLFVVNVRGSDIPQRVARRVSWLFVFFIAGGVLGTVFPTLGFPSLFQAVLPRGVANNGFVHDLMYVQVAQIQSVLGYAEARPSAPFPFTNDWGIATVCVLPFFVVAWWQRGNRWRLAMLGVLSVAAWVIVGSLNRGMWLAILAVVGFFVARAVLQGEMRAIVGGFAALAVGAAVIAFSPLGALVQARFDNPHSDQVRANLGTTAVMSTVEGSPLLGFGSTRDVAGNFASIAGGASDACPNCTPPPLGTHGQLWHVVFVSGLVGAALFVAFLIGQFLINLRARGPSSVAALGTLAALIVTLPLYTSTGIPLFIGMVGIGLLARERALRLPSLHHLTQPVMRHGRLVVTGVLVGALAGLVLHAVRGDEATATQRVLAPATDLVGVPDARPLTMDSEAALATSDAVISEVADVLGVDRATAASALTMGAEANTRVFIFEYRVRDPQVALVGAETAANAYLEHRNAMLRAAQASLGERYTRRQRALDGIYREAVAAADSSAFRAPTLWNTVHDVRNDMRDTTDVLVGLDDVGLARTVSAPRVTTSTEARLVRVAGGAFLGGLLSLPLVWLLDRHRPRMGGKRGAQGRAPLPVLGIVSSAEPTAVLTLTRAMTPLAGVLADPCSRRAMNLTSLVDGTCERGELSGARVVLVLEAQSSMHRARRLSRSCANAGMDPVGFIVVDRQSRRARVGSSEHDLAEVVS